jgi:hypothetical protein
MIADSKISLTNDEGGAIMVNYEIRIEIKVSEISEECTGTSKPIRGEDGSFKISLPAEAAISIDKSEQAFLEVGHAAMRDGIAQHLGQMSKKKPLSSKKMEKMSSRMVEHIG